MEHVKWDCECFSCLKMKAAPALYEALKDLRHKYKVAGELLGLTETHILNYLDKTDKALDKAGQ